MGHWDCRPIDERCSKQLIIINNNIVINSLHLGLYYKLIKKACVITACRLGNRVFDLLCYIAIRCAETSTRVKGDDHYRALFSVYNSVCLFSRTKSLGTACVYPAKYPLKIMLNYNAAKFLHSKNCQIKMQLKYSVLQYTLKLLRE